MKNIAKHLLYSWPFLLGLLSGLYFITLNITGKTFSHFPGDLGDARFNNYILEHAYRYFSFQLDSYWNAPFIYPESKVITYSDNLLGSAPVYSFFRVFGCDRETSFQWWFLVMSVLSYITCYFFIKKLINNRYAAVLGAMVFAFSMAMQSQMTHAQTFARFPIPLALWMGILFLRNLNPLYFFATLFFIVYQFYCGLYLGFMLVIPVFFFLLFSIINKFKTFRLKIKSIKWTGMMMGSLLINLIILLPLMIPYVERSKQLGLNQYENILLTIPTLKSFLFSQQGSLFWDFLSQAAVDYPAWWDHQIFPGGIAFISFIFFGFYSLIEIFKKNKFNIIPFDNSYLLLFLSGIITFFLFIRFNHFSLYKNIFPLPGFGAMRCLTRIINVELIFFAIGTAFAFKVLITKLPRFSVILFIVCTLLITFDNYFKEGISYRTEKTVAQNRVNILIEKMRQIPKGSVVSYEPKQIDTPIACQIDAMLAAQSLGLKSVNGYSATSPPGFGSYWNEMNEESRKYYFNTLFIRPDTVYVVY